MSDMQSLKWYQDKSGKPSTMRIVTMMGAIMGVISFLAYIVGVPFGIEYDIQLVIAGAGLFAVGEISKSVQSRSGS